MSLGRLVPVCCTSNIPAETLDRFITLNQDYHDVMLTYFVFIDDLSKTYTTEAEIGSNKPSVDCSPFDNQSPQACFELLMRLKRDTDSDIDCTTFVILDDRSVEDETVLLVVGPETDQEETLFVRASFEIANYRTSGYQIAEADITADQHAANNSVDGVLRRENCPSL